MNAIRPRNKGWSISMGSLLLLVGGGVAVVGLQNTSADGSAVVAIVEGREITLAEIRPSDDILERRFKALHKREPSSEDGNELQQLRATLESKAFASRARVAVRETQAARMRIEVTKEEVAARLKQMTRNTDVPVAQAESRATFGLLADALDAVCERGEDPSRVYEQLLVGKMSIADWEGSVKYNCAPSRRQAIRNSANDQSSLDEQYGPTIREALLEEKFRTAIDEDLAAADPEFAEYIQLATSNPTDPRVQAKPANYREAKHQEWWEARYRDAEIEFLEQRFRADWPPKKK